MLKNAAIIYLVNDSPRSIEQFVRSLTLLRLHFLNKWPYPVFAFVESGFSDPLKEIICKRSGVPVRYYELEFRFPEWIDANQVPDDVCGFPVGYRHMCRFFAVGVYTLPIMRGLEWYWRLDTDSFILSEVPYDLFVYMKENEFSCGYINRLDEVFEVPDVVQGLWGATEQFSALSQIGQRKMSRFKKKNPKGWDYGIYYTNFEIASLNLWKVGLIGEYIEYIDQNGGIYSHRWGDAPIHTLAVEIFLEENKKVILEDVHYLHQDVEVIGGLSDQMDTDSEKVFENVYKQNLWGGGSGGGSCERFCEQLICYVKELVVNKNVLSVLDIGCGDWRWASKIRWPSNCEYLGVDVVMSIVSRNKLLYSNDNIEFRYADAELMSEEEFSKYGLCIVKDVLQHWETARIMTLLPRILSADWCLFVNDFCEENADCHLGQTRPLDLKGEPFGLDPVEEWRLGAKSILLVKGSS